MPVVVRAEVPVRATDCRPRRVCGTAPGRPGNPPRCLALAQPPVPIVVRVAALVTTIKDRSAGICSTTSEKSGGNQNGELVTRLDALALPLVPIVVRAATPVMSTEIHPRVAALEER